MEAVSSKTKTGTLSVMTWAKKGVEAARDAMDAAANAHYSGAPAAPRTAQDGDRGAPRAPSDACMDARAADAEPPAPASAPHDAAAEEDPRVAAAQSDAAGAGAQQDAPQAGGDAGGWGLAEAADPAPQPPSDAGAGASAADAAGSDAPESASMAESDPLAESGTISESALVRGAGAQRGAEDGEPPEAQRGDAAPAAAGSEALDGLAARLRDAEEQIAARDAAADVLREEMAALRGDAEQAADLRLRCSHLEGRVAELEAQLQQHRSVSQGSGDRASESQKAAAALLARDAALEELNQALATVGVLQERVGELEGGLAGAEEALALEKSRAAAARAGALADLERAVGGGGDRRKWPAFLSRLVQRCEGQAAAAAAAAARAEAGAVAGRAAERVAELEAQVAALEAAGQAASAAKADADARIEHLTREMRGREDALLAELAEARHGAESAAQEAVRDALAGRDDAARELDEARRQVDTWRERASELSREVAALRHQVSQATARHEDDVRALQEERQLHRRQSSARQLSVQPEITPAPRASDVAAQSELRALRRALEEAERTVALQERAAAVLKEEVAELRASQGPGGGIDVAYLKRVLVQGFVSHQLPPTSPLLPVLAQLLRFSSADQHRIEQAAQQHAADAGAGWYAPGGTKGGSGWLGGLFGGASGPRPSSSKPQPEKGESDLAAKLAAMAEMLDGGDAPDFDTVADELDRRFEPVEATEAPARPLARSATSSRRSMLSAGPSFTRNDVQAAKYAFLSSDKGVLAHEYDKKFSETGVVPPLRPGLVVVQRGTNQRLSQSGIGRLAGTTSARLLNLESIDAASRAATPAQGDRDMSRPGTSAGVGKLYRSRTAVSERVLFTKTMRMK
ncbi:unnamed protein product [Pedinophyceae sp. YPF-701]|nr:unnamed protein product [Pedinophyceae sp. YPF-701]